MKPLAEHPEAKYCISRAGMQRFNMITGMLPYRDPDTFEMHTFNDAALFGLLEVMENQILDFEEAHEDWKAQWAVCEAVAMFIGADDFGGLGMYVSSPYSLGLYADLFDEYRVDDPETVDQILDLLGKLFLAMLAKLERLDLLKPDSEVKNLAAVMIMFIGNSQELSHYELRFPESFATNVLAYALKHGIALSELFKVDEFVKDHSEQAGGVTLPAADSNSNDPWEFSDALKKYRASKDAGGMGGDQYDITTWTPSERKASAFNKRKDPCPKSMIDALKKGMVMGLG